jgi:hypothetical protein
MVKFSYSDRNKMVLIPKKNRIESSNALLIERMDGSRITQGRKERCERKG